MFFIFIYPDLKDFTGKKRILNMNEFAFLRSFARIRDDPSGYPQSCGKSVDICTCFNMVFHSQKVSSVLVFGTYPLFPPHYGSYC